MNNAQLNIRAINRQDLDIVLFWSAGWRGFTPIEFSSSVLVHPLLLLTDVKEGGSQGHFVHLGCRKRLPLHL